METLRDGFFIAIELMGAAGEIDYEDDTGERLDDVSQSIGDVRLIGGKDFAVGSSVATVFAGYGARRLEDESGGLTTQSGLFGYDRVISYFYIPVGTGLSVPFGGKGVAIEFGGEYRIFLDGESESDFSDIDPALPDVTLDQDDGGGFRLHAAAVFPLGRRAISVGPFYERWTVDPSEEFLIEEDGEQFAIQEPRSRSERFGIAALFRF